MARDSRLVFDGFLTIDVPATWEFDDEEASVITIYDPDGVGVLQFSFANSETGDVDVAAQPLVRPSSPDYTD